MTKRTRRQRRQAKADRRAAELARQEESHRQKQAAYSDTKSALNDISERHGAHGTEADSESLGRFDRRTDRIWGFCYIKENAETAYGIARQGKEDTAEVVFASVYQHVCQQRTLDMDGRYGVLFLGFPMGVGVGEAFDALLATPVNIVTSTLRDIKPGMYLDMPYDVLGTEEQWKYMVAA